MKPKNFILLWLCVGICVLSGFILTLTSFIQTQSILSLIAFIVCFLGSVVFGITFILAMIQSKKNKK